MNTEEKEKIEGIYREAKRIRILFGASIVILSVILLFLAPIIIHNYFTIASLEASWGIPSGSRIPENVTPQKNSGAAQIQVPPTTTILPVGNKNSSSSTPYAQ